MYCQALRLPLDAVIQPAAQVDGATQQCATQEALNQRQARVAVAAVLEAGAGGIGVEDGDFDRGACC